MRSLVIFAYTSKNHLVDGRSIVIPKTEITVHIEWPLEKHADEKLISNDPRGFSREIIADRLAEACRGRKMTCDYEPRLYGIYYVANNDLYHFIFVAT
jgi:hypothetical protein